MSQLQGTILNGSDQDVSIKNMQPSTQDTIKTPVDNGPNQNIPNANHPQNIENVQKPPLTRLDSRQSFPRPGFPNQPGVQFRPPPPRVGGPPQFVQRPPPRPPVPGQHQYPPNIGPRPANVLPGVRPATPFPRQPPPASPRPQIYPQKSFPAPAPQRPGAESEQLTRSQTLDSTDLEPTNHADDINRSADETKSAVAQNRSMSITSIPEVNPTNSEDRRKSVTSIGSVEENRPPSGMDNRNGKIEEPLERPESRANAHMNKIEEDEIDQKSQNNSIDDSPKSPSPQQKSEIEVVKSVTKTPEEKKSPQKGLDLSVRPSKSDRKTPDSLNGKIKSPKSEGDNDSGVDESTQGNDQSSNGDHGSPRKSTGRTPTRHLQSPTKPRCSSRGSKSPLPKSPDSAASSTIGALEKKKLSMNKIQVGAAPSPNLKVVKSKIGSLQNTSYKPGGGNVKIENKKIEIKAQPRIAAKNEAYTPKGGDKKSLGSASYRDIPQQKLQWNAKSKIGSLENTAHKPKGGDKKIETIKLDFKEKAKPKVGSKDNIKYVPGGGDIKSDDEKIKAGNKELCNDDDIETKKLDIKAAPKVGSMDNVKHKPKGGDKKIFDDKEYLRQMSGQADNQSFGGSQNSKTVTSPEVNVISPTQEKIRILDTMKDIKTPRSRPSSSFSRRGSIKKKKIVTSTPSTPTTPTWKF